MALRQLSPTLDPTAFAKKAALTTSINNVLNNSGTNCDVFGSVGNILDMAKDALGKILDNLLKGVSDIFGKIEEAFKKFFDESGISAIIAKIEAFMDNVNSMINSVLSKIEEVMNMLGNAIDNALALTCNVVKNALSKLDASMISQNPSLAAAKDALNKGATDLTKAVQADSLKNAGADLKIKEIETVIQNMSKEVKSFVV